MQLRLSPSLFPNYLPSLDDEVVTFRRIDPEEILGKGSSINLSAENVHFSKIESDGGPSSM